MKAEPTLSQTKRIEAALQELENLVQRMNEVEDTVGKLERRTRILRHG